MEPEKKSTTPIIWIVLVIIALAGCGATGYLYAGERSKNKDLTNQISRLQSTTPTPTATTTPVPTQNSMSTIRNQKVQSAIQVCGKVLTARQHRDLSEAAPYVTADFLKENTREGFAGTSSPSMGKYDIKTGKYLEAADLYQVSATLHWYLQGEESGTSTADCMLVDQSGTLKVNEIKWGPF